MVSCLLASRALHPGLWSSEAVYFVSNLDMAFFFLVIVVVLFLTWRALQFSCLETGLGEHPPPLLPPPVPSGLTCQQAARRALVRLPSGPQPCDHFPGFTASPPCRSSGRLSVAGQSGLKVSAFHDKPCLWDLVTQKLVTWGDS